MKIANIVCSAGKTGFFFDDQKAIKAGAVADGAAYLGEPQTPGFSSVRQAGESISVMFILEDGQIAYGDCAAVQYSGAGGRDPLFLAGDFIPVIMKEIAPLYIGKEISTFREMASIADRRVNSATGKALHTAIRYGVTQACLDAVAKAGKTIMAKVIAKEYGLELADKPIPIFSQSGDDRYTNTDKMILKGSHVLPHGLFNNVPEKVGLDGEKLAEYVTWLKNRIIRLRPQAGYSPVMHLDVYGTLGIAFNNDLEKIADYLKVLEENAKPFSIRVEGPVDMGEGQAQIEALAALRKLVESKSVNVEIVADEWCNTYEDVAAFTDRKAGHMAQIKTPDLGGINNTIEAVLYCKKNGMGAYLGGTCNETNRSAEICAHIAMATSPDQILAKPGMGVDEGFMIVFNEMNRILALKAVV
ncbi:MAG: methylaspartate ammonia-lyase [Treponema sp.]|nr:methylaspartate ammonia-lyase [Treponema sp.]